MCLVLEMDLWDKHSYDEYTDGYKIYQVDYWSRRLDFHGLSIRQWKHVNNDNEWKLVEYAPLNNDNKHGWCTTMMISHPKLKDREGWYHQGKRQGVHRIYAIDYFPEANNSHYIREEQLYEDDLMLSMKQYNKNGQLVHEYEYNENQDRHGIHINHLQKCAFLYVNGSMLYDLKELHIDYTNMTEADIFTLTMLGM